MAACGQGRPCRPGASDGMCHRCLAVEHSEPGTNTRVYKGGQCCIETLQPCTGPSRHFFRHACPRAIKTRVPNAGSGMALAGEEGAYAAKNPASSPHPSLPASLPAGGTLAEWAESMRLPLSLSLNETLAFLCLSQLATVRSTHPLPWACWVSSEVTAIFPSNIPPNSHPCAFATTQWHRRQKKRATLALGNLSLSEKC